MKAKQFLLLSASALTLCLFCACRRAPAEQIQGRVARMAELEIDPAQLENYKAALREEIETSIRVEPGVLTLYAVSVKGNPAHKRMKIKPFAIAAVTLSLPALACAQAPREETTPALTPEDVRSVSPALERYTQGALMGDLWKRPDLSPSEGAQVIIADIDESASDEASFITGSAHSVDGGAAARRI